MPDASSRRRAASGHVFVRRGVRGDVWYLKFRTPGGKQVQERLGPAHDGNGRPPAGSYTRRAAQEKLEERLVDARRGKLAFLDEPNPVTFDDAVTEWLRHGEKERGLKPGTLDEYRSVARAHLVPKWGGRQLDSITRREIEAWRRDLLDTVSQRTTQKIMVSLHGVFARARRDLGLAANPVSDVEPLRLTYSGEIHTFSTEEVAALIRAAASEQDAAIFAVGAQTGLRMGEILALRWRDVSFGDARVTVARSWSPGGLVTPKSGRTRSVALIPQVAERLARLAQRQHFVGDDDLVFPGEAGTFLDRSALRRRFKAARDRANLPPLRFHDLRHHFGSTAINVGSLTEVQHWMGHADHRTTARYLHYRQRRDEAARLAAAFTPTGVDDIAPAEAATGAHPS